jgi:hypothetical protein
MDHKRKFWIKEKLLLFSYLFINQRALMHTFHNRYTPFALIVTVALFSVGALADINTTEDTAHKQSPVTLSSTNPVEEGPPTLNSVTTLGSEIVLSWTTEHTAPEGGYDTIIDGVDTNTRYRTTDNTISIDSLDLTSDHCFRIQARYTDSNDIGEVYNSNQLCREAQTSNFSEGPPTLTSVNSNGSEIVLSWTTEHAVPEGGYDTIIDGVDTNTRYRTTATTISIDGLDLSSDHCFRIQARYTDSNDTGEVYNSNQMCSVVHSSGGSVTLSWEAPSEREDGNTLFPSEIEGYRLYMGDSAETLELVMDVSSTTTQYELEGIATGTYYFSVTTYDAEGNESNFANVVEHSLL